MPGDPVCIRKVNSVEEAEIIAAWLEERGVEATVVDSSNPGVMAFGVTDLEGVAIYVADVETADRAKSLLAEHDEEHAAVTVTGSGVETMDVTCPECGRVGSFPVELRGTVQECPTCGTHIDVPAGDG